MGSGVGKKRKIIVVCGEAEGNNQGKNRDKRRIVQTKEIVAYRVLLSVNKFCRKREWKKKKDSQSLLYVVLVFSYVTINTAVPELTLPCQTASVLAVAQKSSSFKFMLTVKNISKPLEELVCQLFYLQYCVHLYCLFKLAILSVASELPSMYEISWNSLNKYHSSVVVPVGYSE